MYKSPLSNEELEEFIRKNEYGYILLKTKNNSNSKFILHKSTCYSSKSINVKNYNIVCIENYAGFVNLRSYMCRYKSKIRTLVHGCSNCCRNIATNSYNNDTIERTLVRTFSNITINKKDNILERIKLNLSQNINNSLVEINKSSKEDLTLSTPHITITKDGHEFYICINIINGKYNKYTSHISFSKKQPTTKTEYKKAFFDTLQNKRNIYIAQRRGLGLAILNISNSLLLMESDYSKSKILISNNIQNIHFGIDPIIPPYWTAPNEVLAVIENQYLNNLLE